MKILIVSAFFLFLCACKDGQLKIQDCSSTFRQKEINTASSPTTFGGTDKIAIRLGLVEVTTVRKILLKAWNFSNPAMAVDFYYTPANVDPDKGTHLGGTQAQAESSPTSATEVRFTLADPIDISVDDEGSNSNIVVVLSFGSGITLDLGASSGSILRSDFVKFTGTSWMAPDKTNNISFGIEGDLSCGN